MAWYYKGLTLQNLQRLEEAARAFESAVNLNPELHDAIEYRASCLFETGQYETALEAFEEVGKRPGKPFSPGQQGNLLP